MPFIIGIERGDRPAIEGSLHARAKYHVCRRNIQTATIPRLALHHDLQRSLRTLTERRVDHQRDIAVIIRAVLCQCSLSSNALGFRLANLTYEQQRARGPQPTWSSMGQENAFSKT